MSLRDMVAAKLAGGLGGGIVGQMAAGGGGLAHQGAQAGAPAEIAGVMAALMKQREKDALQKRWDWLQSRGQRR